MKRPAACFEGDLVEDLTLLTELLGESYAASYKDSSLKVRRRYRKLLVALEIEDKRREHAPAQVVEAQRSVGLRR